MIHAIYLYFIINASIAYRYKDNDDAFFFFFWTLIIGAPTLIYFGIVELFKYIFNKSLIRPWYRLWFTDYFASATPLFIKIRRQQYHGTRKVKRENMNAYERLFYRRMDKKYGYGITSENKEVKL